MRREMSRHQSGLTGDEGPDNTESVEFAVVALVLVLSHRALKHEALS